MYVVRPYGANDGQKKTNTRGGFVSERIVKNVQGLRAIAVLLIVLSHLPLTEEKYEKFDRLLPDLSGIFALGVDLFFLISDFAMIAATRTSFQSKKDIQNFIYLRITRIYPLYWVYSGIVFCRRTILC